MKSRSTELPEQESEQQLIERAQEALSQCRWTVGECAARWTQRFAKGRTDADFGQQVGLSADQIFQRRRVWEVFHDVRERFSGLKWSHFYAVLTCDDAHDCLQWALENQATVAEMRAWRRARRGEDLTQPAEEEFAVAMHVPTSPIPVQDPAGFGGRPAGGREARTADEEFAAITGVARHQDEASEPGYTPFRPNAGSPAPRDDDDAVAIRPVSPPILFKRMAAMLERCCKVLTPEMAREFAELPDPLRKRFLKAVADLQTHVAPLQKSAGR